MILLAAIAVVIAVPQIRDLALSRVAGPPEPTLMARTVAVAPTVSATAMAVATREPAVVASFTPSPTSAPPTATQMPVPPLPTDTPRPAVTTEALVPTISGGKVPMGFTEDGAPYRGNPNAPVTLVEHSEFQSPYCGRHTLQTGPLLYEAYIATGKVKHVFLQHPLESIHPQSPKAAEASLCAGKQGAEAFWTMHEFLFKEMQEWSGEENLTEIFKGLAGELGLDTDAFVACLESGETADQVQSELEQGEALGVSGVPAFFVNDWFIVGAQSFEVFQETIEKALRGEHPPTVHIAPDGSGDYPSLEEAVEAVAPGSTITLDAGTYRLQGLLNIQKPLRLVGVGMDRNEIASDYGILYTGSGLFGAEGLTFRYTGSGGSSVVTVSGTGAEVDFSRCRFTGGVWSEAEQKGGDGLRLGADTVGQIRDCRADGNQRHGIFVGDQAKPTLEGNTCTDNAQGGIVFTDNAGGVARDNDCPGNGLVGIGVDEQAEPMLEDNRCWDNGDAGIAYWHNAGGIARGNECSENLHGIAVSDQAEPTLEMNVCATNQDSGFRYAGSAGGVARFNVCLENGSAGILVRDQARPTLEGNACHDNEQVGIAYLGDAGGLARENECSGNGHDGIGLFDQAAPTLEENVCTGNGEVGIRFSDESSGVARGNECAENQWGIFVAETADPNLENNDCRDNSEADVLDMRP